jgi:hypothetical protein
MMEKKLKHFYLNILINDRKIWWKELKL